MTVKMSRIEELTCATIFSAGWTPMMLQQSKHNNLQRRTTVTITNLSFKSELEVQNSKGYNVNIAREHDALVMGSGWANFASVI
jgi:hypothetical protein